MLLLSPEPGLLRGGPRRVVLFGVGLLGSAVRAELLRRRWRAQHLELTWHDLVLQRRQLEELERQTFEAVAKDSLRDVRFVWSAGQAGFASSAEDTAGELESFKQVLGAAERIAERSTQLRCHFDLLSSVGGLFEGQRSIRRSSVPRVLRPYGALKKEQEDLLLAATPVMTKKIYRVTSVFGSASDRGRRGLIPVLIYNGKRRQVTKIVGRLSTLRDFVWAEDVARYVVGRLLGPGDAEDDPICTLASMRPASLHEVLRIVESAIGHRPYIRFADLSNSMDITVSPSLRPTEWHPVDLKTAIYEICRGEELHIRRSLTEVR